MTREEIDRILGQTLQDQRLSGGEKKALAEWLAGVRADAQRLAFCRHRAFELARASVINPEAVGVIDWLEEVVKVMLPEAAGDGETAAEAYFSPDDDCCRRLVQFLGSARQALDVCVFTITDDRLAAGLLDSHRRGVRLRVLTDNEKAFDLGSDVERLRAAGVEVRVDRSPFHMHHKYAVCDGRLLVTGSYNWTRGAASDNKENFLISDDRRLVSAYARAFERLWAEMAP